MRPSAAVALWANLLIGAAVVPTLPARADCASVVAQLKPLVARITDPELKQLVMLDLRQAHVDILEGDEEECATWVIHAARLMGCRRC